MPDKSWWVYTLLCADESLYTGITTDPARRLAEHNQSPQAARYTRARRPLKLCYLEPAGDRSAALIREAAIKRQSRARKQHHIAEQWKNTRQHAKACKVPTADCANIESHEDSP